MAKPTKLKPKPADPRTPADPEVVAARKRLVLKTIALVAVLAAIGGGFTIARQHVERRFVYPSHPPKVVLTNKPAWMSEFLTNQIIAAVQPTTAHSAMDHQLLVDRTDLLRANPWVKSVKQVRRAYHEGPGDVIEIECEWRTPAALVQWRDHYWLVDSDGVKLPERFDGRQLPLLVYTTDRQVNLRVIEGVLTGPPGAGEIWRGEELIAGIELAAVLAGQPWANEIERVNVANFGGRLNPAAVPGGHPGGKETGGATAPTSGGPTTPADPQLTLITRYNTEIRWGRPISEKDFFVEVPWQRKVARLEQIWKRYGRVDAGAAYVELRFDEVEVPITPSSAQLPTR